MIAEESRRMRLRETRDLPNELRESYLRTLPAAQELFLEHLVQEARKFLVIEADEPIGYAAIQATTLVEFHLLEPWRGARDEAFTLVHAEREVRTVLCKSFDALVVAAAALRPARVETTGWLFRAFQPPRAPAPAS
jgi:hypothetical protein